MDQRILPPSRRKNRTRWHIAEWLVERLADISRMA